MKKMRIILFAGIVSLLAAGCGNSGVSVETVDNAYAATEGNPEDNKVEVEKVEAENNRDADELVAGSEAEFDKEFVIKVGDNEPGYFIWKVADKQGFFAEEFADSKISVEVERFSGGPAIMEALTAGEIQFGVAAVDPLINAVSAGSELTTVLSIGSSVKGSAIYARKEAGINSLEDLKGHTIAVLFGTSRYNTLLLGLQKAGLTPEDVEIMNLSNADTLTAIQSGQVDAAVLTAGIPAELEEETNVVAYDDEIRDTFHIIIGDKKFANEHPYTTARLVRALVKTNEWIQANKEDSIRIYSETAEVEEDIAERYYVVRENVSSFPTAELKEGYQKIIDTVVKYEIVENPVNADDILDPKYAELAGLSVE
ncbi:MAG: ABC transporter substrate-binding protein [Lachnospiraceae bacterium]|nr:ABC transporter substrate-binding protein [Lachnospiraceae bacterium]